MRIGLLTRDLGAASGGGGWRGRKGNPGGDGVPGQGVVGADGLAWPWGGAGGLAWPWRGADGLA